MKLKCRIHEKDYDIVSGATFSDEYNETLDSGSIVLDHVKKIENLKPFDDVYVWNADQEFHGYTTKGDRIPVDEIGQIQVWFEKKYETPSWEVKQSRPMILLTEENGYFHFSGDIMKIWNYLLYHSDTNNQWRIDKIPLELSLTHRTFTFTGYYKLGSTQADIVGEGRILKLIKDTDYASSNNLPDILYVVFDTETPMGSLTPTYILNFNQLAADSLSANPDTWTINSISLIPDFNYVYYKNSNYVEKSSFDWEISGLTLEMIQEISNIRIPCVIRGERIDLIYEKREGSLAIYDSDPNNIRVMFHFRYGSVPSGGAYAYAEISLYKVNDTLWFMEDIDLRVQIAMSDNGAYAGYEWFAIDILESGRIQGATTIIPTSVNILPRFFKHLVVDKFVWDMVDFDEEHEGQAENYKYKIDLMSETKLLEKVILPNISITQPISGRKRTIWYYLKQFVDLYSPKIKMASSIDNQWIYTPKFQMDDRESEENETNVYIQEPVKKIFDDYTFAPELSLTAPNLRDVLSRLMIVKDCIPIVRNGVIYAMKISKTHGIFQTDRQHFSWISGGMDSSNYSTAFRREYGNAISQNNSTHMIEYLGFRCRENALMTLDNMYIETRFPIYKINHLYMCFYKRIKVRNFETNQVYDKLVLIKQDISRLVLQNVVRDTLAADWTAITNGTIDHASPATLSQWKVFTLGFDIGSNRITGWGEEISYIKDKLAWQQSKYTYIETIMTAMDRYRIFGMSGNQFLAANEELYYADYFWEDCVVTPNNSGNITDIFKTLFFQMDYIGMYSGAVVHAKENADNDDLQTSDNCSSALSILEVDGLFEKEKANRIGNEDTSFIARFSNVDEMNNTYNDIVGAKWDKHPNVIIYHREYQIYDDCVIANFAGTEDYVMKNYFTTVFAKYRTYSYASYTESINRAENDRYLLVLSDDSCYYEEEANSNGLVKISSILSAFSKSDIGEDFVVRFDNQINAGFFAFTDGNKYFSDVNQFVAGMSLCFNIKTFDPIVNGNYISSLNCYTSGVLGTNKYVGSTQGWYKMPVTETDGFVERIGCYFGNFSEESFIKSNILWSDNSSTDELFNPLFKLPLALREPNFKFGKEYNICKDEKEILDFTLQYEVVNYDKDVVTTEWLMKLTDFGKYIKTPFATHIVDKTSSRVPIKVYFGSKEDGHNYWYAFTGYPTALYLKQIMIRIKEENANDLVDNLVLNDCYTREYYSTYYYRMITYDNTSSATYSQSINLGVISHVNKQNGVIISLTVRAQITTHKKSGSTSLYVPKPTFENDSSDVVNLTFNGRATHESGWLEFYWEGLDSPGYEVPSRITHTLKNGQGEVLSAREDWGSFVKEPVYTSFPKTMFILVSTKKMEESLVYQQFHGLSDLPEEFSNINYAAYNHSFEDIFKLEEDEYGRSYIHFRRVNELGRNYESVQYWYYDAEGDGYLHLVFGVNVNRNVAEKKIYISLVKNRNSIVYNGFHREVGKVMNFAEDENKEQYGKQLFTEMDGDE